MYVLLGSIVTQCIIIMYTLFLVFSNFTKQGTKKLYINPLNAKLNPICHLLVLLGAHHILHVSRIRVNL